MSCGDAPPRKPRVILGVSGSVAAVKVPQLCAQLHESSELRVVCTHAGLQFFDPSGLPPAVAIYKDESEWREWKAVGDPVLHIELRKWADLMVIAPLSANTLAKLANGMCDNLLTCIVRAWDFSKPLLVAPAMNTYMWSSPFTGQHLAALQGLGATVIPPVDKRLACGDVGVGAIAAPADIVAACASAWMQQQPPAPGQDSWAARQQASGVARAAAD